MNLDRSIRTAMTNSAHDGGNYLISSSGQRKAWEIEKGCRNRMMNALRRAMPQISEWDSRRSGQSAVLCPLDSMINFTRGHGPYGLMAALVFEGESQCGAIYLPKHAEFVIAEKGRGAYFNDSKIVASGREELHGAVIRCDHMVYDGKEQVGLIIQALIENEVEWQNLGSPAEAFMSLIRGKADGYVSPCIDPSHMGGYLAMEEARVMVTDSKGKAIDNESIGIVAARPGIHEQLLELVGNVL